MPNDNCETCLHRREQSTFPKCVKCLKDSKIGNQFPEYEPEQKAA